MKGREPCLLVTALNAACATTIWVEVKPSLHVAVGWLFAWRYVFLHISHVRILRFTRTTRVNRPSIFILATNGIGKPCKSRTTLNNNHSVPKKRSRIPADRWIAMTMVAFPAAKRESQLTGMWSCHPA